MNVILNTVFTAKQTKAKKILDPEEN